MSQKIVLLMELCEYFFSGRFEANEYIFCAGFIGNQPFCTCFKFEIIRIYKCDNPSCYFILN